MPRARLSSHERRARAAQRTARWRQRVAAQENQSRQAGQFIHQTRYLPLQAGKNISPVFLYLLTAVNRAIYCSLRFQYPKLTTVNRAKYCPEYCF
jgi:hypothetical protein